MELIIFYFQKVGEPKTQEERMKQNKDKEIRDLKWEIYDLGVDVGDWKFYTFFFGMMVGVITFLLIFSFVDWTELEQELQSCQDKVPEELREVNITIEGFDKIKLKVWCWSKGYPNFDGNDSRIWEIVKNCEVVE